MQDQHEEARLKLEEARSIFIDIGNRLGAVQCLRSLGDILRMQAQYEEARLMLEEARSIFINIGNECEAEWCTESLNYITQAQKPRDAGTC
jgi:tetratricopeptide (TPR) repeat protein